MVDFILNHLDLLINVGFLVIVFILSIVLKKRPSSDLLSVAKEAILEILPVLICTVEEPGNGDSKKTIVLTKCLKIASDVFGRVLTPDELRYFSKFISEQIESILLTPQSKIGGTK